MQYEGLLLLLPLLLMVRVSGVYSGHSLLYFQTMESTPGYELQEHIEVGYVDGVEITRYSSDVRRLVPVAPWMQKMEPEYWESETHRCRGNEAEMKYHGRIELTRLNKTGGYQYVQWMYGCELRDDGSTRVYYQFGLEGKDFFVLDSDRWILIPLTGQAHITTERLNGPDERLAERNKDYLEDKCFRWMRGYLKIGKEQLERRVPPEVKVSDQTVNGVTKLHCQVYGFYPRDVDVNWMKNGIDVPSYEAKHILPNSDGTYQIRVTAEVAAEDREGHSCHVDHASLDQTLTVKWESQSSSNTLWIVIAVLAGVLAIAAIGFIIWRISSGKKNYAQTSTSDNDGSTSTSNA
uniref:Ig-like domain-containing protein n=1 Tax=Leptobrachium leishanense TaxID=445787 RepID=A0A8C5MMB0_9ANUR